MPAELAFPGPPPDKRTMLVMSVMGVPLYSARGLSRTLEPIDASKDMRRSINGVLTNVRHEPVSEISVEDNLHKHARTGRRWHLAWNGS